MKFRHQSTTYLLVPIIVVLPIIYSMMTSLIDNLNMINHSLTAYAICSREMIDYAFLGETFNYTVCYNNLKNSIEVYNCTLDTENWVVTCKSKYFNEEYIYPLPITGELQDHVNT